MNYDAKFDRFIVNLNLEAVAETVSRGANKTVDETRSMLDVYVNEARATLHFIEPWLERSKAMLEVGAGLCIFSLFLKSEGFNIHALEPAEGGFESFEEAKRQVVDCMPELNLPILELGIQDLPAKTTDTFDLIFSNNVLEHIPELELALDGMLAVLSSRGAIVHSCPNYLIPYEPHLGIPVMAVWPGLSELIYPSKVDAQRAVWRSLNFVTAWRIRRYAKRRNLQVKFVGGQLHKAFLRLDAEPLFRARQSRFVRALYRMLCSLGLIGALKHIPGSISTPMVFEMSRLEEQR